LGPGLPLASRQTALVLSANFELVEGALRPDSCIAAGPCPSPTGPYGNLQSTEVEQENQEMKKKYSATIQVVN
jgi:hypothetical protein